MPTDETLQLQFDWSRLFEHARTTEYARNDSEALACMSYLLPGEAGAHEMRCAPAFHLQPFGGEFNDCMKVNTASMRTSGIVWDQTFSQISESS